MIYNSLNIKYDYWPLNLPDNFIVGEESIKVYKDGIRVTRSSTNGFTYENRDYQNQNTRYFPTPGEPYSGYMVQLHGVARVIYPECLQVEVKTPEAHFGYIYLRHYPDEESIEVFINGNLLSQSNWELLKDENDKPKRLINKNINVLLDQNGEPKMCGGDYCPNTLNPYTRTGYFIRLKPNSVFQTGNFFSIDYHPGNQE